MQGVPSYVTLTKGPLTTNRSLLIRPYLAGFSRVVSHSSISRIPEDSQLDGFAYSNTRRCILP